MYPFQPLVEISCDSKNDCVDRLADEWCIVVVIDCPLLAVTSRPGDKLTTDCY